MYSPVPILTLYDICILGGVYRWRSYFGRRDQTVHDWLQIWRLKQENQNLRDMLEAAKGSRGDGEPSRRDLTQNFEAEEHGMAGDLVPVPGEGPKAAMPGYQEVLGLVGSSQTCSKAVSASLLLHAPRMRPPSASHK